MAWETGSTKSKKSSSREQHLQKKTESLKKIFVILQIWIDQKLEQGSHVSCKNIYFVIKMLPERNQESSTEQAPEGKEDGDFLIT